jgi:uncharacterized protein YcnI
MKIRQVRAALVAVLGAIMFSPKAGLAHVTLRTTQPLKPSSFATITLNAPNEWSVDNTKITLEVPEAFLKAGGRISGIEYPPGWQIHVEKEDKPGDIYQKETETRAKRQADRQGGTEHATEAPKSDQEKQGQDALDEMRKKWIKKITFEGVIPPEAFKAFQLSLQLPDQPGKYQFSAIQTYSDGKEVSWSELVEGAEHPAPSITVEREYSLPSTPLIISILALLIALTQLVFRSKHQRVDGERSVLVSRG